jgi:nicotinate phosphoribosyltransferase
MVTAAAGRPLIEMGSRRTHEEAAVASARAAWIAGFEATSNLMARHRFEIPSTGTSAHSFTLLHDTEEEAFRAQVEALGAGTTLLVDTYDVTAAVALAVEVAGPGLGAVRLDSGDLGVTAQRVREQLDSLGAPDTKIVVTSDLDEFAIAGLAHAPVDAYGVGTNLVVGSGHPTCGFVYKLVARADDDGTMRSVAKKSVSKTSVGGKKFAARRYDERGTAVAELVGIDHEPGPDDDPRTTERELLVDLVSEGRVVGREPLQAARDRHAKALTTMPLAAQRLSDGQPAIETVFV